MTSLITAQELRDRLYTGPEIALLDVREHGQYGEGHILFAAPCAYSNFDTRLPSLVPNTETQLVLYDSGNGVADLAADRATAMGYANVCVLGGGAEAWSALGHTLFRGVNVPSKIFGELVEHARDTPRITADELAARKLEDNYIIVDGRTEAEFRKMNIPGGRFCPNGELALRIAALAPDPQTDIVVNCAGRTRSIIGAQTLIDMGIPNRVVALENGTQGWFLAGHELQHGSTPQEMVPPTDLQREQEAAGALAARIGVPEISLQEFDLCLSDELHTTYVFDVRTHDEYQQQFSSTADSAGRRVVHAPGGQLIQATDQWVGVRRARIVLVDTDGVRAKVVAAWLRQLGHDAITIRVDPTDLDAFHSVLAKASAPQTQLLDLPQATASDLLAANAQLIDLRSSGEFRTGHIGGSVWSIRPQLAGCIAQADRPHILITPDADIAKAAAIDLKRLGVRKVSSFTKHPDTWPTAGFNVIASSDNPPDEARIDYLFFVHDRHDGNPDAARAYLAWETGLIAQLHPDERAVFRI